MEGVVGALSVVRVVGLAAEKVAVSLLEDQQTVWRGEVKGALLTLNTAIQLLPDLSPPSVTLLIDNQAVLLSPTNPLPTPGQFACLLLRDALLRLIFAAPGVVVVLTWCQGHQGVDGNWGADREVERAAEEARRTAELRRACVVEEAGRGQQRQTREEGFV